MIKGIDVLLYEKSQTGTDAFNRPIYQETPTTVSNVLVAPAASEAVVAELNLTGKKLVYELYIPKGDEHDWVDKTVEFYGEKFRTFGFPQKWVDSMVPLSWNKKIKVERYG